uniref:hypothetical protein n=1 Tax=Algoriphagus sp. TaxID=1872435 RepID=UPI004047F431
MDKFIKSPFTLTSLIFSVSALFAPKFLIFLPIAASLGLAVFSMYRKEGLRHLAWSTLVLGGAVIAFLPTLTEHYADQQIERARAISEQATPTK